jgi:hypothetical protein
LRIVVPDLQIDAPNFHFVARDFDFVVVGFGFRCGVCPGEEEVPAWLLSYVCRSTISSLICAIALAGLRCLGQAWAQFMMVWQR